MATRNGQAEDTRKGSPGLADGGLKGGATRVAVLKAVRDAVEREYEAARREVLEGLRSARDEFDVKSIRVTLSDGTPVATITLCEPRPAVVVRDEAAFLAWVEESYPSEVERTVRVRPAWQKAFLAGLDVSEPVADPRTGEIVPGLEVLSPREPRSFSLRPVPGGREEIARAWRSGELDLRELLALEPGGR